MITEGKTKHPENRTSSIGTIVKSTFRRLFLAFSSLYSVRKSKCCKNKSGILGSAHTHHATPSCQCCAPPTVTHAAMRTLVFCFALLLSRFSFDNSLHRVVIISVLVCVFCFLFFFFSMRFSSASFSFSQFVTFNLFDFFVFFF
uniref:(northern house mosquito) hypothetical protein n=1 Tax=Culex pipiens TaxID=7175 RepID=A0A8D8C8Q2_CULPI